MSTYSSRLLRHLEESQGLHLLRFDPKSRRRFGRLVGFTESRDSIHPAADEKPLGVRSFLEGHPQPLQLARGVASYTLFPFYQCLNGLPRAAAWRLGRRPEVDVYHWTGHAFMHLPDAAHVVTVHDAIVLFEQRWHRRSSVLNEWLRLHLVARHADRLIVDSKNTLHDVVRLLGVPPGRIDVIPLAPDPRLHPPSAEALVSVLPRYGLEPGKYFICLATIEPRKNLVRLAQAFRAMVEHLPDRDVKLVLAGSRGWLTQEIDRGLGALQLGKRLVMPGRVPDEDLPALLGGAIAMPYVSLYEGFGLPPLEAMACGTPVIASNNSSLPEVVGDSGLLVDPLNVGDISEALERVLIDDDLRARLAAAALARAGEFTWARTARMTIETYRRAVQNREVRAQVV